MKKVLVYGMSPSLGGVERFITNFCFKMSCDQIQFDYLISSDKCALSDEIKKHGSKIIKLKEKHSLHPIKFRRECIDIMSNGNYDVFWLNDCSLNSFHLMKVAKKCNIKTRIIHSHNSSNMDHSLRGIIKYIIHCYNKLLVKKYATHFWACSDVAAKFFYTRNIISDVMIIKNGIDVEKFKFDLKVRNEVRKKFHLIDSYVIGHVGRFHFQKNHKYLIETFMEYHKINNNSKLLLIGDGEDKKNILDLIDKYNLNDSILFLGVRDDVHRLMQAMDVFVLPSLFEGLPIVGIEAQCTGLPCIFSDKITQDAKIISDVYFCSIEHKSISDWIEKLSMLEINKNDRSDMYRKIIAAGYDLQHEANKIKKFFLERGE